MNVPPDAAALAVDLADASAHVGERWGPSSWRTATQSDIDQFADVAGVHNHIHADPARAAWSPHGKTVAHGSLRLSLVEPPLEVLPQVTGMSMGVEYGSIVCALRRRCRWNRGSAQRRSSMSRRSTAGFDADLDLVVQTHLRGTFTCARAPIGEMRARADGGRLILFGSPDGQRGTFGHANYAATRSGVAALAHTWAIECGRRPVTVNAVIPTAFTQVAATTPMYAPLAGRVAAGQPLPRAARRGPAVGLPQEAGGRVVFLASDQAAVVTGQCIGPGGDRLGVWSHLSEVVTAYQDGGWDATDFSDEGPVAFAEPAQDHGVELSPLDESAGAADA